MPLPRVIDSALYHGGYWASFWAFTLGWGYRASGREHLPKTGPALIVANHSSYLDPVLVGLAAPRPLTYLARSGLFNNKLLAAIIRAYGAVPIDRSVGKDGLQAVMDSLKSGRAVLMFPEGERTHTGTMQPLKAGISLLVKRADVPVVPCGVRGGFRAWSRFMKAPRLAPLAFGERSGQIAVAFGECVPAGYYRRMDRDDILTDLHARMTGALDTATRMTGRTG